MRQRFDITDVEAKTKIRAKYLRALENEDFGMLPGPTFVKSFLRTYAEFLGLDPHVLVEEYRARHDPRPARTPSPSTSPRTAAASWRPASEGLAGERACGCRRHRHRATDGPGPGPKRAVAGRPPARARDRAGAHHDLRRPTGGHGGG